MIRLVLGRKERGKTTLAYYLASKLPRRVVWDPRGLIRRPGAVIARSSSSLEQAMAALADGEVHEAVYVPSDHLADAWPAFAAEVKRWIDERPAEPLAVLVDELTFVSPLVPDFEWAIKCCRATVIHFFLTCHRPADVPVDVRAIADYWYLFGSSQEHDLAVIQQRCGPEIARAVSQLKGSEFMAWNDRDGTSSTYRDPAAWYVELAPGRPVVPPLDLDTAPA